ncbi:hypothetical protein SAMN04488130_103153 [Flavobacterium urumqiense]|uniref:Uncharacterized protein n=1 Tax=Flavobacterium urumqiense TaxID=935224 RepID=A0A1H5VBY1_9FLAO|nr:hypothetical protein SAMN04488130_103153 [Flavobacterium urumqiense]
MRQEFLVLEIIALIISMIVFFCFKVRLVLTIVLFVLPMQYKIRRESFVVTDKSKNDFFIKNLHTAN